MSISTTPQYKKKSGDRRFRTADSMVLSNESYITKGERHIIVKDVDSCRIKLNSGTTDHVYIKAFSDTIIIPDMGLLDGQYDELMANNGVSMEFKFILGTWYIISSDGVKSESSP